MKKAGQSRVVGLMGVGFDREDSLIRITKAENYQVLMGSPDSHKALHQMCLKINEAVQAAGRELTDYTPEEFMELIAELY